MLFGFVTVLLAACGGGGGGCSGCAVTTPSTPSNFRPAAAGDSFAYAGTMTETFVRPPLPAGAITPSPNPTLSATITTAVTQAISIPAATSFNGVSNALDFHTVESDKVNGGLETTSTTSDDFYHYAVSGSKTDLYYLGSNATTSTGVVYATTIGSGNGLVDVLPEKSGPITPANGAAEITSETDPDGATDVRTTAADGSYTENGADVDGTARDAVLNSDGSGSYEFPFGQPEDISYTVSAPTADPSTGPDVINITLSIPANLAEAAPSPSATPVVVPVVVDAWYGAPAVLFSQTLRDIGQQALPSSCGVPAALTLKPNSIVEVQNTIDPVFGETDATTTTTYTENNVGVACISLSDTVTQYYDLSGQIQSPTQFQFSSTPYQTTTTTETLGITSVSVGASSVARSQSLVRHASLAHFRAVLAQHRAARHAAFTRALTARLLRTLNAYTTGVLR